MTGSCTTRNLSRHNQGKNSTLFPARQGQTLLAGSRMTRTRCCGTFSGETGTSPRFLRTSSTPVLFISTGEASGSSRPTTTLDRSTWGVTRWGSRRGVAITISLRTWWVKQMEWYDCNILELWTQRWRDFWRIRIDLESSLRKWFLFHLLSQRLSQEITFKLQPECLWQFQTSASTICKIVHCDNLIIMRILQVYGLYLTTARLSLPNSTQCPKVIWTAKKKNGVPNRTPRSPIIGQCPWYWTTHILLGNWQIKKLLKQKL